MNLGSSIRVSLKKKVLTTNRDLFSNSFGSLCNFSLQCFFFLIKSVYHVNQGAWFDLSFCVQEAEAATLEAISRSKLGNVWLKLNIHFP